jgi:hypothetical protein
MEDEEGRIWKEMVVAKHLTGVIERNVEKRHWM